LLLLLLLLLLLDLPLLCCCTVPDAEREEERSARGTAPTAGRTSRPIPESWLELELLRHEASSGCSALDRDETLPPAVLAVALLTGWGCCWAAARLLLLCARLLLLSRLRGEPVGVVVVVIFSTF